MNANSAPVGFRSATQEYKNVELPVEGNIPNWLSGSLIRNGPGLFEYGDTRVNHWFDGLAMLRRYHFASGTIKYSNRFIQSESYATREDGPSGQFATNNAVADAKAWIKSLGPPEPTDNTNIHVLPVGDYYIALTETPRQLIFDPITLETEGELRWEDDITEHIATAHHTIDPATGEAIGFGIEFGMQSKYHVYQIVPETGHRQRIGTVPTQRPSYIHDCAVTSQYVILVESPLVIQFLRALLPWGEGLLDALSYDEDADTRFVVIDRDTGELVADPIADQFFTLHHINAYDDNERIVIDLVAFEDAAIIDSLQIPNLTDDGFDGAPTGEFRRYKLPISGDKSINWSRKFVGGLELPTVPMSVRTRPYRYAYAQATDRRNANGIVKIDAKTGRSVEWWEPEIYIEEPRMIQHPDGSHEDEGVVIASAVDTANEEGLLLVFDAETLTMLAKAKVPEVPPFGFHGRFIRQ